MTTSISDGKQTISTILVDHIGYKMDENQQFVDPDKLYITDEFSTYTYRNWKRSVLSESLTMRYSDVLENYGVTIHNYKLYTISKWLYSLLDTMFCQDIIKTENIIGNNEDEFMYLLMVDSDSDMFSLPIWKQVSDAVDDGRLSFYEE